MVDVETGFAPKAMRALDADSQIRAANGGAVKRPGSKPGSAPASPARAQPDMPAVEPKCTVPERAPFDEAEGDPPSVADGLLWLEDPAETAVEPGDGSPGSAPWRRGLRA
jgi:hypothetical protein